MDGTYLGAPDARDVIQAGDNLLVYGRLEDMKTFDLSKSKVGPPPTRRDDKQDVDEPPAPGAAPSETETTGSGISA